MPYIRKDKCVYKKNPDGSSGEKVGCSDSAEQAKQYLKKLYSIEEMIKEEIAEILKERRKK